MHSDMQHGTLKSATLGYLFSLALSGEAYLFVTRHLSAGVWLIFAITAAALVQLLVQMVFFLHITEQFQKGWSLAVLGFAALIVTIVVGGSLWIMGNLNHQMTPAEMQHYITGQDGL